MNDYGNDLTSHNMWGDNNMNQRQRDTNTFKSSIGFGEKQVYSPAQAYAMEMKNKSSRDK